MNGRRADVDSEMLLGTCGNSTSSVGGQEGLCKAHSGLSGTPQTNANTGWRAPLGHPRETRTPTRPRRGASRLTIELVMLRLKAPCPWASSSRSLRARWERLSRGRRPVASIRLASSGSPCVEATALPSTFPPRSCRGQSEEGDWWGLEDCSGTGHPAHPRTSQRGSCGVNQRFNKHMGSSDCSRTGNGCICYRFPFKTLSDLPISKTRCQYFWPGDGPY